MTLFDNGRSTTTHGDGGGGDDGGGCDQGGGVQLRLRHDASLPAGAGPRQQETSKTYNIDRPTKHSLPLFLS